MPEEPSRGYTLELSEPERMRYRMMAGLARENEADLWEYAGIVPGARVADVGCGPGAVLTEIAQIVGPEGTAVGVEPGQPAREAAREELDSLGLEHVEVREGNGEATGLDPGAWDCVVMRHVLTHTGEAVERIVAHLATLLAPGGHLYLVDVDLDATRSSPADPDIQHQFERYADVPSCPGQRRPDGRPARDAGARGRTRGRRAPGLLPARPRHAHGGRRAAASPPRTR